MNEGYEYDELQDGETHQSSHFENDAGQSGADTSSPRTFRITVTGINTAAVAGLENSSQLSQ